MTEFVDEMGHTSNRKKREVRKPKIGKSKITVKLKLIKSQNPQSGWTLTIEFILSCFEVIFAIDEVGLLFLASGDLSVQNFLLGK